MAAHRQVYTVHYRVWQWGEEKMIDVIASSKSEAYILATYDAIPAREGTRPYSSWVSSVTYNNGNCHYFNTCEGLGY